MEIMQSICSEIDAILRAEIELAQKDDPSLIVRLAFAVIEDFLSQGMSLVGIPVDRDRSFRFVVTGDSGSS